MPLAEHFFLAEARWGFILSPRRDSDTSPRMHACARALARVCACNEKRDPLVLPLRFSRMRDSIPPPTRPHLPPRGSSSHSRSGRSAHSSVHSRSREERPIGLIPNFFFRRRAHVRTRRPSLMKSRGDFSVKSDPFAKVGEARKRRAASCRNRRPEPVP